MEIIIKKNFESIFSTRKIKTNFFQIKPVIKRAIFLGLNDSGYFVWNSL
jgi:hypothetical protein